MTALLSASRLLRAFRRRGPVEFVRLCLLNIRLLLSGKAARHGYVYDDAWDRQYGVDTAGTVEVADFTAPEQEKAGAVRYEPTPPDCFAYLVGAANLRGGVDYIFMDVGSGKGRVLLMAALHGFRRVIGIELGEELHQTACRNINAMKPLLGDARVESLQTDATRYGFPLEPTVCFLNNPFDAQVLDRLLDNIEASLAAAPRPFTIIYYHSNHADRIDVREQWQVVATGFWRDESHHFSIYRALAES